MVGPAPHDWAVEPQGAGARQVVPGVWRLRLPTAFEGIDHVNAYVIEREDDGIVLVDCGSAGDPSYAAALDVAMEQTGHALDEVRVLVGTHVHSDHVGLAALVLERSGCEYWAHPDDAHFYDATREPARIVAARARRARLEGVPEARLEAFSSADEEVEGVLAPVAPHSPLADGVIVESALGPWRVIETPGHCPSHVCLVQRDHGIVIAGDLLCSAFVPWMDYGYSPDPLAETLSSLDRVAAEPHLALVLPGHGRPIPQLEAVVEMTRDGLLRRLKATLDTVRCRPGGAYDITVRMFGEESDMLAVTHMTEVLAYLRHLRLRGDVARDTDSRGRHWYRATPSRRGGP